MSLHSSLISKNTFACEVTCIVSYVSELWDIFSYALFKSVHIFQEKLSSRFVFCSVVKINQNFMLKKQLIAHSYCHFSKYSKFSTHLWLWYMKTVQSFVTALLPLKEALSCAARCAVCVCVKVFYISSCGSWGSWTKEESYAFFLLFKHLPRSPVAK